MRHPSRKYILCRDSLQRTEWTSLPWKPKLIPYSWTQAHEVRSIESSSWTPISEVEIFYGQKSREIWWHFIHLDKNQSFWGMSRFFVLTALGGEGVMLSHTQEPVAHFLQTRVLLRDLHKGHITFSDSVSTKMSVVDRQWTWWSIKQSWQLQIVLCGDFWSNKTSCFYNYSTSRLQKSLLMLICLFMHSTLTLC